ncbi:30S ribosomal protein S4 [Candidatus Acetothermia bacterium]|nr:MAG: 30S ribosomal protein S4 [Candidatus Acetothermia bacterium]RLE33782.1 MAG: 30S ribosomal protein S4 [Candidatus Acetothermia bacterium]
MGRYTGPKCRLCRREGTKLFLKGDRCYSDKCAMNRRPFPPGQHGRFRRRLTGYAIRLREKQKLKRIYGIREEQFRRYIEEAQKVKGRTGTALLRILEERLDNVVYRAGFASSRAQARQLVSHGHFLVNGRVTDIPSYRVEPGDVIEVKPQSKDKLRELIKGTAEKRNLPSWLARDLESLRIQVTAEPAEEDLDKSIDTNLIVEFYSR